MVTTEIVKAEPLTVADAVPSATVVVGGDSPLGVASAVTVSFDEVARSAEPVAVSGPVARDEVSQLLDNIAATTRERAYLFDHSSDAWVQAGFAALAAGDPHSAVGEFDRALGLDPQSKSAHLGLARAKHELGDTQAAIETLKGVLNQSPDDLDVRVSLAVLLASSNEQDAALKLLSVYRPTDETSAGFFAVRGGIHLQSGNFREAISDLRKAVRLKPEWVHARNSLGVAEIKAGHWAAAEKHFREASRIGPLYSEGSLNLLRLLKVRGRWSDLLHAADALWTPASAPVEVATMAGTACLQTDDNRAARMWLSAAEGKARSDTELSEILNDLGVALHRLDRPEEAGDAFERAARLMPSELTVINRAKAYLEGARFNAALEWLLGWQNRIAFTTPESLRTLALCLFHVGQYKQAIVALESPALQARPTPQTQALLSMIYADGLLDYEAAVQAARRGLDIDASDPGLVNNLAYALLESGRIEEAAAALDTLGDRTGTKDNAVCLAATRGLLALLKGDLKTGLDGYESALALAPFQGLRERVKAKRDLEAGRAMLRLGLPLEQARQRLARAAEAGDHAEPYREHARRELAALPKPPSHTEKAQ